jgi:hypothetical protein
VVALEHAREAAADGGAGHVDELTLLEDVGAVRIVALVVLGGVVGAQAELLERAGVDLDVVALLVLDRAGGTPCSCRSSPGGACEVSLARRSPKESWSAT